MGFTGFNQASSLNAPDAATPDTPPSGTISLPESQTDFPQAAPKVVLGQQNPPSNSSGGLASTLGSLPAEGIHLVGKAYGHILSGLSGTEQSYAVDPNTGKTVVTTTKAPPGQWARGVLAAGLLGSAGIDQEHGQKTFAQGLLAGLSGGAKARKELNDQDEAKKRAAAEQDYVNSLKAQENTRQDKELSLKEILNKAQVARENSETAVADLNYHNMLQDKEGAAGALLIKGAKDKVDDYISAGETPVKEGLTVDDLHALLKSDPGSSAKYLALPTGQRVEVEELPTGEKVVNGHTETTYSLFTPLTTVPQSLVSRMKELGIDKKSPAVFNEMAQAAGYDSKTGKFSGTGGQPVDYRHIAYAQKLIQPEVNAQKDLDEHNLHMAETARAWTEQYDAKLGASLKSMALQEQVDTKQGTQLFNRYFDVNTQDLRPSVAIDLNPNFDATGKPRTPKDKQAVQHNLDLVAAAITDRYDAIQKDLYDHYKNPNGNGLLLSDDHSRGLMQTLLGLKKSSDEITNGFTTIKKSPPGTEQATIQSLTDLQNKVVSDAPSELSGAITYYITPQKIKDSTGKEIVVPPASSLREALDRLDQNQQNASSRVSAKNYEGISNALREYYQNAAAVQNKIINDTLAENTENRYQRLHALNPNVTYENMNLYNDNGVYSPPGNAGILF